eukprot:gene13846-biopygen5060
MRLCPAAHARSRGSSRTGCAARMPPAAPRAEGPRAVPAARPRAWRRVPRRQRAPPAAVSAARVWRRGVRYTWKHISPINMVFSDNRQILTGHKVMADILLGMCSVVL